MVGGSVVEDPFPVGLIDGYGFHLVQLALLAGSWSFCFLRIHFERMLCSFFLSLSVHSISPCFVMPHNRSHLDRRALAMK